MKRGFFDKAFLSLVFTLALPIAFQNLITSSLNLVDNVMIGRLGETEISAVAVSNQFFFIFMLGLGGINAGANIFMSQFWGKKDVKGVHKVLGLGLAVSLIASILFGSLGLLHPKLIIRIFTSDPGVVHLGSQYLRIVSLSFIITAVTLSYSTALRSTAQPKAPMYASFAGVAVNAVLNWILIFGKLGFPALGVQGAAIATAIARMIEMIFVLYFVYGGKNVVAAKIQALTAFTGEFVKGYFKIATPVIINEIVWALGMTAYSVAYARIGISEMASMQIALTISNIFMVLCIGLASASTVMIGNKIGAGDRDTAVDYAKKIGILSPLAGIIIGIGIWITSPFTLSFFNITTQTYNAALLVLRIMAGFCAIRVFNIVMIVGVFRGGGDTSFSMYVELGTVWCFAVPLAFLTALYFRLPLPIVYFTVCLEEAVKAAFNITRLRSKKWVKNIIEQVN